MIKLEKAIEPHVDTWDAVWKANNLTGPSPMGQRIFEEICRGVDPIGCDILELGCGSGELLRLAADRGARRVIGVDMSGEALALAGEILEGVESELIQKDMFKLECQPSADIVWSSGVMEHFKGDRMVEVMKFHRQLSRKYVVVVVPASPHWNDIRMRTKKALARYGWQLPLSKGTLKRIGERAGLKLLGIRRFMMEYSVDSQTCREYIYSLQTRWPGIDQLLGGLAVAWYERDEDVFDGR